MNTAGKRWKRESMNRLSEYVFSFDHDPSDCVMSLLKQGQAYGFVTDEDLQMFYVKLYALLAKQADRYMEGRSSSIPKETAEQLMKSILYVIGMEVRSENNGYMALHKLMSWDVDCLFASGLCVIEKKLKKVRHLQRSILNNLVISQNSYYRSTIEDGVNAFFDLYSPQYGAHLIHITADYPLMAQRPSCQGVLFMEQYLTFIQIENRFLLQVDEEDLHHIMLSVSEHYEKIPVNLCQPAVFSALGRVLCGKNPEGVILQDADVERLKGILSVDADHLKEMVHHAMHQLLFAFHTGRKETEYFMSLTDGLAKQIHQAIIDNTLHKLFVVPAKQKKKGHALLSYENRMNDEQYSALSHFLLWCDDAKAKVEKVRQCVGSLSDLLDLLDEGLLDQDECDALIEQMDTSAKEMLLCYVRGKEFLDTPSQMIASALVGCGCTSGNI